MYSQDEIPPIVGYVIPKLKYAIRNSDRLGLRIVGDGFIHVEDLLKTNVLEGYTAENISRAVEHDGKKHFMLEKIKNKLMIKPNNYGIPINDTLSLKLLTDNSFEIVHGTYMVHYEKIKDKGLSRMRRDHIHFAKGIQFISGLRRDAEIFIYIDFRKALFDGLMFYESENNTIISPGNISGYIEPKYFLKVVDKEGQTL